MIDEFNSCEQNPLILPVIIVVCFAIKEKFKIILKKLYIWRLLGIFFAFIAPNLVTMPIVKSMFVSLGIAYSLISNFNPKCLINGISICILIKLASYNVNPFGNRNNYKGFLVLISILVSVLQEISERAKEVEGLVFFQDEVQKKYYFDWAIVGIWLFLIKKHLLAAQFCDSFYPSAFIACYFISFQSIQERYANRRIVNVFCGLSGIALVLAQLIVNTPIMHSTITALGIIGLRPINLDKNGKGQIAMKSFLLFCKLSALDLKFNGSGIFALIVILAGVMMSISTFQRKKDLKDSKQKFKIVEIILMALLIASVIIRGNKRVWKKMASKTIDLDQIRISNLASEAVYLIKDDFNMMPLLRVSITKDPKYDLETAKSLITSLDLDLVVLVKDKFAMNGMSMGEQTGVYYFHEEKKYSLLSKYPLEAHGNKRQEDSSWISVKVADRIINLIAWTEKVRRSNLRGLRSLQGELYDNSTLLLGALQVTPLGPEYHLIFRPTTLSPTIFPK